MNDGSHHDSHIILCRPGRFKCHYICHLNRHTDREIVIPEWAHPYYQGLGIVVRLLLLYRIITEQKAAEYQTAF